MEACSNRDGEREKTILDSVIEWQWDALAGDRSADS